MWKLKPYEKLIEDFCEVSASLPKKDNFKIMKTMNDDKLMSNATYCLIKEVTKSKRLHDAANNWDNADYYDPSLRIPKNQTKKFQKLFKNLILKFNSTENFKNSQITQKPNSNVKELIKGWNQPTLDHQMLLSNSQVNLMEYDCNNVNERVYNLRGATSKNDQKKSEHWFQFDTSRKQAHKMLTSKDPGAFIVRYSSCNPGCYRLSLRTPSRKSPKVQHYLIIKTKIGFKIKGCSKEFTSLKALITHHSVMKEQLPAPLALTRLTYSKRNELDYVDECDLPKMNMSSES